MIVMVESNLQLLHSLTRQVWPNATLSVSPTAVQISLSGYNSARILLLIEAVDGRTTPLLVAIAALQKMVDSR